ncbi:MAG: hypothetical protein WKF70_13505, partial [Chitinophagaceae bacterium]
MNRNNSIITQFEKQKNVKASAITLGVGGALLFLFFLINFPLPQAEVFPPVEDLMEVNLGSSDLGSGNDQPMLPGEPAPAEQVSYAPPVTAQSEVSESKDVETDDREDNLDAPVVRKPTVATPKATRIDNNNKVVTAAPAPSPVVTPAPPRPKAVLGRTVGGNGNGGNGADTYKPGTGEGVAGGTGDQGRPGGSPNGSDYTGTPRNLSVRVVNIPAQNFQDEFNEGGKIALDVVVNEAGKLVSAQYQPRGSSLPRSSKQAGIALQRAREISYPKYDGGFKQTLNFN